MVQKDEVVDDRVKRYLHLEELKSRVDSALLELRSARAALKAALAAMGR